MLTVAIYHKSVPAGNKNLEKPAILTNFAQGVRCVGDNVIDVDTLNYTDATVGVIQGWTHEKTERLHLVLRQQVIAQQPYTVAADSNLFLYKNKSNPCNYLRYSFNGIFPNTGTYCDTEIDARRWRWIKRDLGLDLKDYRSTGSHILLCLQRNGGWSMDGIDVQDWAIQTVKTLRLYTDRPIVIRAHPGDKSSQQYLDTNNPLYRLHGLGISISATGRTLEQDLHNAWAVVNYNSSAVVGAAIEGYPVFVTDPSRSQCQDIANTDLSQIETPNLPNRLPWVERISMFHWKFTELANGVCWQHMRKFVQVQ
jgi:hypothetical protein